MNWNKIKDVAWFVFIWVLATELIEYKAEPFIVDVAGNLFGGLALMFVAVERALRDEE